MTSKRPKPKTRFDHPGTGCPCAECAGERCRVERAAQGLGPTIENPDFYRALAIAVAQAETRRGVA